jgi:WD40 repeat protein
MLVITGGKDCKIIVWNAEDGTRMSTLDGHIDLVQCLLPFYLEQESGPVLQIASGSMDNTVKVSDLSKSTAIN